MRSSAPSSHAAASPLFARAALKAKAKAKVIAFSAAVLMACWASGLTAAVAQSALDGFDPNANGTVRVVVVQPDGKILIGGDFTTLSPNGGGTVTRNHIARLNPDGTLDTPFDPNATDIVRSIVVQADGKILVGGDFNGSSSIGGATRNYIARLRSDGTLDTPFDPNANASVLSIVVQTDGKVLAGGSFTTLNPNGTGVVTRNRIARLRDDGTLDTGFDPNANNEVDSIAVQADGKILAGGHFNGTTSIGGATRNYIARLDATTGLADSFDPNANSFVLSIAVQADGKILVGGLFNGPSSIGGATRNYIARLDAAIGAADSFDPNANNEVDSIVVQPDGKILAGGLFINIGGQSRSKIARLDAVTGAADLTFDPNANNAVLSIAVQADGKILAGGAFSGAGSIGGQTRNRIARLETDGRLDQTLNLSIVGLYVYAIAVQPDGKFLIGGRFTTVLGVARNNIARLNTDGTLDTAFDPNASNDVICIAVQADGKILVGGVFATLSPNGGGAVTRNRIARLNSDGTVDTAFNPNSNDIVHSIAVQADGKILVGGDFNGLNSIGGVTGTTRNYIARLRDDGTLDSSFDPNANVSVLSIVVQADGKILAGGSFTTLNPNGTGVVTRNRIARLRDDGTLDSGFDPNADGIVFSIAVQSDGRVLAGGSFANIGGATRTGIARLDATTGAADLTFDPNADAFTTVLSIAVQADGKILAGGSFFGNIGGAPRNGIARLDPTTGLADSFDPNASGEVDSIAIQADGKILAGGQFTVISGQTRNRFARLSNDIAALQNLAVTQTTITWTRGGSSPQLARVTFEYSSDNVNYTPLGNGTATGSNWTLTGLNLSTGQNIYIRARGYYRSGYQNGSESITESVRNAFNAGPTAAPATISGRIITPDGSALGGTVIHLNGAASRTTVSDGAGNYRFDNVETENFYTVTPSLANYQFTPASRSFSLVGNMTDASFTANSDGAQSANAIDMTEYFVRQQYLDFLGREPDQGGLDYWSAQINQCGGDAACISQKRIDVSAAFFASAEFQQTGSYIYGVWAGTLGRTLNYGEFSADRSQVLGGGGLDQAKAAFAEAFVQRSEFINRYPQGMTREQFVDAVIQTMTQRSGVDQSALRNQLLGDYDSGGRALVVRHAAEASSFVAAEYNKAFVLMEYFGYLRREIDQGGYAYWLDVLNNGAAGNYRGMVCAFLTSTEYQLRFSTVVTRSNSECGP